MFDLTSCRQKCLNLTNLRKMFDPSSHSGPIYETTYAHFFQESCKTRMLVIGMLTCHSLAPSLVANHGAADEDLVAANGCQPDLVANHVAAPSHGAANH